MTDRKPLLRARAVADYMRYRHRIQHGKSLCLALGQPQARDNLEALQAWVSEALARYHGLPPRDQVRALDRALCRRMLDAGLVDEIPDAREVPLPNVAAMYDQPAPHGRGADNVIPIRRQTHER